MTLGELIEQIKDSGVSLDTEISGLEAMQYPDGVEVVIEFDAVIGALCAEIRERIE